MDLLSLYIISKNCKCYHFMLNFAQNDKWGICEMNERSGGSKWRLYTYMLRLFTYTLFVRLRLFAWVKTCWQYYICSVFVSQNHFGRVKSRHWSIILTLHLSSGNFDFAQRINTVAWIALDAGSFQLVNFWNVIFQGNFI